jgi:hypothetical protein
MTDIEQAKLAALLNEAAGQIRWLSECLTNLSEGMDDPEERHDPSEEERLLERIGQVIAMLAAAPQPPTAPAVPLAAKHHGMRISAHGLLARVGGYLKGGAREMLKHLDEMATRYYAGDIAAVDEFLQLYCLDEKRPAEQQIGGSKR